MAFCGSARNVEPAPEEDVNLAPEQKKNEEAEKEGVTVEIKWGQTRM